MPKVTVLMPVFNAAAHLRETIDSVIAQTFEDWDMLAVCEPDCADDSISILQNYARMDSRILVIINEKRMGLAESLNLGMRMAAGEYIARIDADDLALPTRFAKQVAYLDANPSIAVCGSWQHHFGDEDWVHRPPAEPALCRAALLFDCHLCHSTLMLRKSVFIDHELFYDERYLAEDFELWSRAVMVADFANIQEVLGEYRHGTQNITDAKRQALREESGHIVAAALKRNLHIDLPEAEHYLLCGWDSVYEEAIMTGKHSDMLSRFEAILRQIWEANALQQFYDNEALLSVIQSKWRWAKHGANWQEPGSARTIEEVFDEASLDAFAAKWKRFLANNPTWKGRCTKIFRKCVFIVFAPMRKVRRTR